MEILVGAVILLGILGTVLPFFPGPVLIAAALFGYALVERTPYAWAAFGVGMVVLALGFVLKWVIPAKHVSGEVDRLALIIGSVAAVVGFFVIPVIGLVIGFVAGVFGTELVRTRSWQQAWPATRSALKAAGISMLIDLASVVIAGSVWLVTVVADMVY